MFRRGVGMSAKPATPAERILALYRDIASEVDKLDFSGSGKSQGARDAVKDGVKREVARALFKALLNAPIDPDALGALKPLRLAARIDEDREGMERSEIEAREQARVDAQRGR